MAETGYGLRLSSKTSLLNIPRTRTCLANRSLAVTGPKWWDELPNHLSEIREEPVFRQLLSCNCFQSFTNIVNSY